MRYFVIVVMFLQFWAGPVWPANDHSLSGTDQEQRARDGDAHVPYITDRSVPCAPTVPGSGLLFVAFGCEGYVLNGRKLAFVGQGAAAITLVNTDGDHYLALDFSTFAAVAGWTRPTFGAHYLVQITGTQPAPPPNGIIFGVATVLSGNITGFRRPVGFTAQPVLASFTVATLPSPNLEGRRAYVTDDVRGTWKDYGPVVGWQPMQGNVINVNDFGAVADSTGADGTDSGAAIQTAFDEALVRQSGIYFPGVRGKCYRSTVPLLLTLPGSGQSIHPFGDGLNSVICGSPGAAFDVLTIDGSIATQASPLLMENLTIYGTEANSKDGLVLINVTKPTLKHVFVTGARETCVRIQGSIIGAWLGGGCTIGVGSPGGVAGIHAYALQIEESLISSGTDGWSFTGTSWDGAFDPQFTINDATNAAPINIGLTTGDPFITGDIIRVQGVVGNTAANGAWLVSRTAAGRYDLTQPISVGNGAYVSGGLAERGTAIVIRDDSFGNVFVGGGVIGAVGVFLENLAVNNVFVGLDTGDAAEPYTDSTFNNGSLVTSTTMGSTLSGILRVGNRLQVAGSDTSHFFPEGSAKLGLKQVQFPNIFCFGETVSDDCGLQLRAAGSGTLDLFGGASNTDGSGGVLGLQVSPTGAVMHPAAPQTGAGAAGANVLCIDAAGNLIRSTTKTDCSG